MADAPRGDDVTALEQAALAAVAGFVDMSPEMEETIVRAARHMTDANGIIQFDLRAYVGGLTDAGFEGLRRKQAPNVATALARVLPVRTLPRPASTDLLAALWSGWRVQPSRDFVEIAGRAAEISWAAAGRSEPDARHLAAAFLAQPDHRIREILGAVSSYWVSADPFAMRAALFDAIVADPQREDPSRWRDVLRLDEPRPAAPKIRFAASAKEEAPLSEAAPEAEAAAESQPPAPPRAEAPRFASDRAQEDGGDALGVGPDAEAFARLICLADVTPLSIGLFGGWGSGKSTFMAMIEQAVDRLAAGEQAARQAGRGRAEGAARFCGAVVQVRFNAWHYADANLWASLTAEFFDQMRAGGWRRSGTAIHRNLVERVNAHVHRLTDEAAATRAAVGESAEQVLEALKERDAAAAAVARARGEAVRQRVLDQVTEAHAARRADVARLGGGADMGSFLALATELGGFAGKAAATARFVRSDLRAAALVALGIGAVAAASWFLSHGEAWPALASAAGTVAALAAATAPAREAIERVLESAAGFADAIKAVERERLVALAEAEARLREAQAEAAARQAAAERASRALARYVEPGAKGGNPPRLLRYMLEDDPEARALEREVGLISRTRRLFQALDEIVRDEARARRAAPAGAEAAPGDPDVPERIVIYIDDLDRCTAPQVYSVLQAIHLLLAFDLFVVVVGVDVGWVQKALAQEIKVVKVDRPQLAAQYLEKIFQLPYWLQPLDGGDGGSYASFVRALIDRDVAAAPTRDATPATEAPDQEAPAADAPPAEEPAPETPAAPEETLEAAVVDMTLTPAERDFLASPALAGLAPRDPRSVKRMLNTYRVIRARLDPARRADLLGKDGAPAAFPVAAILVALECGPSADGMQGALRLLYGEDPTPEAGFDGLKTRAGGRPDLAAALDAAQAAAPEVWSDPARVRAWAALIDRFSFHPPGGHHGA